MAGTVITKKGMQLLVKLIASESILEFTRVAVGTGAIQKGYDPASMVDLAQYKMDGMISECQAEGDMAKITMQISSQGIKTGFTMTEMGVFAEDPDLGEILYAYLDMGEDPQYIYAEGGDAVKFMEVTLEVAIEAATKVSTYINPASMVLRKEFDERMKMMEDSKVTKEDGKGLSSNDYTDAEKNKLSGIEEGANRYIHPDTHPADMIVQDTEHKFVSDLEKAAWDGTYEQSTKYTDKAISDLINGAPETLDTLGEIADAMAENADVVEALNAAIGTKANQNEMERALEGKLDKTGDAKDVTVTFGSNDAENPSSWTDVPLLKSGEKIKEFFGKASTMFKNIRYLRKLLGTTDISKLGDGTVTGALSALNTGLAGKSPSSHSHSWGNITDKPSTFPPSSHSHGYLSTNGGSLNGPLEMYYTTPFIDFHFGGSTADYTSRIIEEENGVLNINGIKLFGSWITGNNGLGHQNSFAVMSNSQNRISLIWTGSQLDLYVDSRRMGKITLA